MSKPKKPTAETVAEAGTEQGAAHELDPLLYTIDEAEKLLKVRRTKLYELIADGCLRSVQIGRARRVCAASLAELALNGVPPARAA